LRGQLTSIGVSADSAFAVTLSLVESIFAQTMAGVRRTSAELKDFDETSVTRTGEAASPHIVYARGPTGKRDAPDILYMLVVCGA